MATECSDALGGEAGPRTRWTLPSTAKLVLLVLPWLWPYTSGPSPNVWPLTVSWACIFVLVIAVAIGAVSRHAWPQLVAVSWLFSALVSSAIGLGQWFDVLPEWSFLVTASVGRAYANLRQPNQFASLTSLGLLGLLWFAGRRPEAWHWGAAVLLAAGNVASASRTGLVQWFLIAVLMAWWPTHRSARLRMCMAALASYAVLMALLPTLFMFWTGKDLRIAIYRMSPEMGCSSRKVLWSNVLELIAERPWVGWGWGELDYAHYAHLYLGPRFCDILDNAHNLPLHVAVELGIPMASALLLGVAFWIWRSRPWKELSPARQLAWCALAVLAVHSLLEYPLWYGPFQLALLASLAILYRGRAWARSSRVLLIVLASGGIIGLVGIQIQYETVSQSYLPDWQRRSAFRDNPVAAAGRVWLFDTQLSFARLSITPLSREAAAEVHSLSGEILHFSPEPMAIERRIESAMLLGAQDDALWHAVRYRAAFPQDYAHWRARLAPELSPKLLPDHCCLNRALVPTRRCVRLPR